MTARPPVRPRPFPFEEPFYETSSSSRHARGRHPLTLVFLPLLCLALITPLVMMNGWFRPTLGAGLGLFAMFLLIRQTRRGWRVEPPPSPGA